MDKNKYISSNNFMQFIKILLFIKKMGYSGTLDPLAEGCLPILTNKYTVLSNVVLKEKKRYVSRMELFKITNTYDSDGLLIKIKKKCDLHIKITNIIKSISNFVGKIYQHTPIYSATKQKGKSLYKFARKNLYVKIKKRKISIFCIKLLNIKNNKIQILTECSSGTYIRSLISDIGYILSFGAFLSILKRDNIGLYRTKDFININQLKLIKKNKKNKMYPNYFIFFK